MSNHLRISSLPRFAVEVGPSVTRIAEGYQVLMGAIGLVVVNMMNCQILSGSTFHTLFAVALANGTLEFIIPFKGIGELGRATVPVWVILAAYVWAVTLIFAGAIAETSGIKRGRRNPESLVTNLTVAPFAALALFLATWIAACCRCVTWLFHTKRLTANLTNTVPGIFLFGKATIPGAKTTTIPVICGRREFKWFSAPAAFNGESGTVSNIGTSLAAILARTFPGCCGVVPELFTARLARGCHPGRAIRFLERGLGAFPAAILSFVAFCKRKLKLSATLFAIHCDHRRHITFTCSSTWYGYSIP